MRKYVSLFIIASILVILAACGGDNNGNSTDGTTDEADRLIMGVTPGPHEEVMEVVKEVAATNNLDIEIKVFTDYAIPNIALAEGDIDANSFQHKPFLDDFKEDRGLDITDAANTINFPMGIYSAELEDVADIKDGDKLGMPNDPTNGAHALFLFEEAGLITLEEGVENEATIHDVVDNPLNLEFIELEASQIPRHLDEVAAAAINTNFAIENGFTPSEDAIHLETDNTPWVNVIAVRTEDENTEAINKLIEAYHSDEVKQFIEEEFSESLIPAW